MSNKPVCTAKKNSVQTIRKPNWRVFLERFLGLLVCLSVCASSLVTPAQAAGTIQQPGKTGLSEVARSKSSDSGDLQKISQSIVTLNSGFNLGSEFDNTQEYASALPLQLQANLLRTSFDFANNDPQGWIWTLESELASGEVKNEHLYINGGGAWSKGNWKYTYETGSNKTGANARFKCSFHHNSNYWAKIAVVYRDGTTSSKTYYQGPADYQVDFSLSPNKEIDYLLLGYYSFGILSNGSYIDDVALEGVQSTHSEISTNKNIATADLTDEINVTIIARDPSGNPLSSHAIRLDVTGEGNFVAGSNPATTDINGMVSFVLKSSRAQEKVISAVDVTTGISLDVQAIVSFKSGALDANVSTLEAVSDKAPADGSPITVTVTTLDAFSNPVSGISVTLVSTSTNVNIQQPITVTNELGKTTGYLTNLSAEKVKVAAYTNGIPIGGTIDIDFLYSDLTITKTALASTSYGNSPTSAMVGYPITYTIVAQNTGAMVAENVVITDSLPVGLTNLSTNGNVSGSTITWQIGNLSPGASTTRQVIAIVAAEAGKTITNTATVSSTSAENLQNNISAVATWVQAFQESVQTAPGSLNLEVLRSEDKQAVLTITNSTLITFTQVSLSIPETFASWVTVTPAVFQLSPGQGIAAAITITPDAASSVPLLHGFYRDFITVNLFDEILKQVPVTIHVMDESERSITVQVADNQQIAVQNATLSLKKRAPAVIIDQGMTLTSDYHEHYKVKTNTSGLTSLTNIESGVYDYVLSADYHATATGAITVTPGTDSQFFSLTMDALPALQVAPHSLALGVMPGKNEFQIVKIQNIGQAPLHNLQILQPTNLDWVVLDIPTHETDLSAGTNLEFAVQVSPPLTQSLGIYLGTIQVVSDEMSQTVPFQVEVASTQARSLNLAFMNETSQPITNTGWVVLSSQDPLTVTVGSEVVDYYPQKSSSLNSGAAQFAGLAPGRYTYQAQVNGYETKSGEVTVKPGSGNEPQIETEVLEADGFRYSWDIKQVGDQYLVELTLVYESPIDPDNPPSPPRWCNGCAWNGWGWTYSSNEGWWGNWGGPGPGMGDGKQYTTFMLSQDALVAGEGFRVHLNIENTSPGPLSNLQVIYSISDANGVNASDHFAFLEPAPISSDLAAGTSGTDEVFIVPQGLTNIPEDGLAFLVGVELRYKDANGQAVSFKFIPRQIKIFPAPALMLDYEMPAPHYPCLEYDLQLKVTNVGQGPMQDFHLTMNPPEILSYTGQPVSFEITDVWIGAQKQASNDFTLDLGYIPADAQVVITWRLRASKPGQFISFNASLQHIGYKNLPLTPVIQSVSAELVPTACHRPVVPGNWPWSCDDDHCIGTMLHASQDDEGGPINTRTGAYDYSVIDLSLPTLAGPREFKRWYASQGSQTYTLPLGSGWTHSLDMYLGFVHNSQGGLEKIYLKAHSANRYEFFPDGDKDTFISYPGVCGTLVRYDPPEAPEYYQFTDNGGWVYTFRSDGKIIHYANPQGKALTFEYDTVTNRLVQVGDGTGRLLQFSYDDGGRLEAVSDHSGRQAAFAYDPATGDLTQAVDVLGHTWTYSYTVSTNPRLAHLLTQITDPAGRVVERTVFDSQGRAVEQFNGAGERMVQLAFGTDGVTEVKKGADQLSTWQQYDPRGTLTTQASGTASQGKTFDDYFNPVTTTDALSNTTQMQWSADGKNLEQVTNPAGFTTRMAYDAWNNLITKIDNSGYTTTNVYSGSLLLRSTDAGGYTTVYTYTNSLDAPQPAALLKATRTSDGLVTSYLYDIYGQKTQVTNPSGQVTRYYYDNLGRVIRTDQPGYLQNWTCYDLAGRTIRSFTTYFTDTVQLADACTNINGLINHLPINESLYDLTGNRIASIQWTRESGQVISHTVRSYYDEANRTIAVVRNLTNWDLFDENLPPENLRTHLQNITSQTIYDISGKAIATINPFGRIRRTYYDLFERPEYVVENLTGQLITVDTPPPSELRTATENITTQTIYDKAGNSIGVIDPLGRHTRFYFDALNRPVTVVQNLTGQNIDEPTPPERVPNLLGQNVRTDTIYDPNGNVIAKIDPLGIVTRTYYDALNRSRFIVRNLVGQDYSTSTLPVYDPAYPDRNLITETRYDPISGRVTASVDVLSRINQTYYDAYGRVEYVLRNQTGAPDPKPAFNPDLPDQNVPTQTVYDVLGRSIATIDASGRINRTYYDQRGRVEWTAQNLSGQPINLDVPPTFDPNFPDRNITTQTIYDSVGRAIATRDTLGRITRTYFDPLGRAEITIRNWVGPDLYSNTPPTYDPIYPDRNLRTQTIYDAAGQAIAQIDPLGHIRRTYYDPLGRTEYVVENLVGQSVEQATPPSYDPLHPDWNKRTQTLYDAASNVIANIDPIGRITRTYYDELNRPVKVVYNLVGAPVDANSPLEYNPLNADCNIPVRTVYDLNGNGVQVIRLSGLDPVVEVTTAFEYDALGRLKATIENFKPGQLADAQTNVRTEYSYDASGNRLSLRDPSQHSTLFQYDGLDRLLSQTDALNHTTVYTYNAAGQRAAVLDANGVVTAYQYDHLGRLTLIDYPASEPDTHFGYNGLGWSIAMTDSLGVTSWLHDALGRPLTITMPVSGTNAGVVGYQYDGMGNRTRLVYPDGKQAQYQFDGLNRLIQVQDWQAQVYAYTYTPSGALSSVSMPNGVVSQYIYDGATRLSGVTHLRGEQVLATYTYSHDPSNNVIRAIENVSSMLPPPTPTPLPPTETWTPTPTDTLTPTPTRTLTPTPTRTATQSPIPTKTPKATLPPFPTIDPCNCTGSGCPDVICDPGEIEAFSLAGASDSFLELAGEITTEAITITYTYDVINRLLAADYSDGNAFTYQYDASGNVAQYGDESGETAKNTTYTYNDANQLVAAQDSGQNFAWQYAFDANGSLVEIMPGEQAGPGARRYTYNTAGWLTRVDGYEGGAYQPRAEMAYDGLGNRRMQSAYAEGISVTTGYIVDSQAGGRLLVSTAGSQSTYYLYGLRTLGELAAAWSYPLSDATGTPRLLSTSAGEISLSTRYTPWGEVLDVQGQGISTLGYLGGLMDAATGLIYVGEGQYYDPSTGRFLTTRAQPGKVNPYVPRGGDASGILLGPLALMVLLKGKRNGRKLSRVNRFIVLLILFILMAMIIAGCRDEPPLPPPVPPTPPNDNNRGTEPPPSAPGTPPPPTSAPTPEPTSSCTPTSAPPRNWKPEKVLITHYATVLESDPFFPPNPNNETRNVPIYHQDTSNITWESVPKYSFYVGNTDEQCKNNDMNFDNCKNWRVSVQGSGRLTEPSSLQLSGGKMYVQADTEHLPPPNENGWQPSASYYFTDEIHGTCATPLNENVSIAVAKNMFTFYGHSCNDKYYIDIPGFENTVFTIQDTGSFVVENGALDHFDIYVGTQTHSSYYSNPEFTKYDGQTFRVAPAP